MLKKLCAWIVSRVDNRMVIHAFEIMRIFQRPRKRQQNINRDVNNHSWGRHKEETGGYIENQHEYMDMNYGITTMAYSCCEILAVYNALHNLNILSNVSLPDIISEFEKRGMVLSGRFGTAPKAILHYLMGLGLTVRMTTKESEYADIAHASDTLILTMFNDGKDVFKQIHTVNISKDDGMFTAHNVYGNGSAVGPCASVSELLGNINGGKAKGIALIGVNRL